LPWNEVSKLESRMLFISAVKSNKSSFSAVCGEFGISRKTGYKWLKRFNKKGQAGLADRSRRPHNIKYSTSPEIEKKLVHERKLHPAWGARKLCKRLENSGFFPPPERTANRVLARNGLVFPKRVESEDITRFERPNPNDLWQIDHKSAIHGSWIGRAVPFVVLDDCSRYLLGLRSQPNKGLIETWTSMWNVFGEFGLPKAILSDNDNIFHGSVGPSRFEVRLLRLGINILHGRPYHPQTQGKVERLNGTLEAELLRNGIFRSYEELQENFDNFRFTYNFERPHEALSMEVPGSVYRPSIRNRPSSLPKIEYPPGLKLRKVQKDGWISWKGRCVEVGVGLHGEHVEVREMDYGVEVYYGSYRVRGKKIDNSTRTRNERLFEKKA